MSDIGWQKRSIGALVWFSSSNFHSNESRTFGSAFFIANESLEPASCGARRWIGCVFLHNLALFHAMLLRIFGIRSLDNFRPSLPPWFRTIERFRTVSPFRLSRRTCLDGRIFEFKSKNAHVVTRANREVLNGCRLCNVELFNCCRGLLTKGAIEGHQSLWFEGHRRAVTIGERFSENPQIWRPPRISTTRKCQEIRIPTLFLLRELVVAWTTSAALYAVFSSFNPLSPVLHRVCCWCTWASSTGSPLRFAKIGMLQMRTALCA